MSCIMLMSIKSNGLYVTVLVFEYINGNSSLKYYILLHDSVIHLKMYLFKCVPYSPVIPFVHLIFYLKMLMYPLCIYHAVCMIYLSKWICIYCEIHSSVY